MSAGESLPIGTVLSHPCPLCSGPMVLRGSRYGLFYGCVNFPVCRSTHGAHPDGRPLGIPGDAETKAWRIRAHEAFDRLWQGGGMRRGQAYAWMRRTLGLSKHEAHIGRFDPDRCRALIAAVERKLTSEL